MLGISALFDGGSFARLYLVGGTLTRELVESPAFQTASWVAMALYLPLSLLFWHAPALVHWHGVPTVKSLFFSLVACLRNIAAMVVFLLGWMLIFCGVGLALMLLSLLLGQPGLLVNVMYPASMVLAAMFFSSIYFSFRDSFITDEAQTPD